MILADEWFRLWSACRMAIMGGCLRLFAGSTALAAGRGSR